MKNRMPIRRIERAIKAMMDRLVACRLARSPQKREAEVRQELWQTLREHAGLEDPNRLDGNASSVVWVLTALLELEKDAHVAS